MLSIDPPDEDDEDEEGRLSPTPRKSAPAGGDAGPEGQVVNGDGTPDKPGPDGETVTPVVRCMFPWSHLLPQICVRHTHEEKELTLGIESEKIYCSSSLWANKTSLA